MTRDAEIERLLEHWFIDGPTRMPDRFLGDTLDRINRKPRRRLSTVRTRLAAAAGVVVVVAGLGAVAFSRTSGVGVQPSQPAPQGPEVVPAALQASWSSHGSRQTPGGCCPRPYDITIGPTTVNIPDFKLDVLSSLSMVGPDSFEVRVLNTSTYWQCQVGDIGSYRFRLASDGGTLTLTPVRDDCAARSAILTGEWTRPDRGQPS